MSDHALAGFHPAVAAWFRSTYGMPTRCQAEAWPAIGGGRNVLIAAPTGSGKTLAAFLAVIDALAREGEIFGLPDETRVLYVSPLKALSNDVEKNLEGPLAGIHERLFESGALPVVIRAQVRTGDTPAVIRTAMAKRPPQILVTTPESLYILLTSDGGRRMLRTVQTLIVDEIHALVATKRGAHLALSVARLGHLTGHPLRRIGLSATQNPIDEVARFLTGGAGDCVIVDHGHRRRLDLAVELPPMPLQAVLSHQAASDIYNRMADLIRAHRTSLIFVNTRRLAERVAHALTERLGGDQVTSHHGSLSREQRLTAEDRLKRGQLRALVATASLELGIDVGDVELVCQLGSTGSIATFVQRVGRSGHTSSGAPKGRLFPTTRDDLVECAALIEAVHQGRLDRLELSQKPLDVLAQQIVAMVAAEDWSEDALFRCIIEAYPYRGLSRLEFDELVLMLSTGYSTSRGERGAYLHRDGIHKRLRARRGARLTAITCGGAIADNAEYRVVLHPAGEVLGAVDEHFAIESVIGDVFQLGNTSWRVLGLEGGTLRVADAQGQPPSIPFWFGEAPGRSEELSEAVSQLRRDIEKALERGGADRAMERLQRIEGIAPEAARQVVSYLGASHAALGLLPTRDRVVFERFFDESGGMQFIIHAPFGSRINRAWGLALRKRFCRTFNFELQAAANENALILSLGTSQSFPLEDVQRFLKPATAIDLLVQAVLDAPMFIVRWRWNAVCSLAVKRFLNGRQVQPHLLRMQAEDLVTSVFPDQRACLENIVGDREIPDHPLVRQTIHDCLNEAMDGGGFVDVLAGIHSGAIEVVCCELAEPSPLAAEIVNARVYSFLDGAPLEERRTRAVTLRRGHGAQSTEDFGSIDGDAAAKVQGEACPDPRDIEELHDALLVSGYLVDPQEIASDWHPWFRSLGVQGRATRVVFAADLAWWVAAERWPLVRALHSDARAIPALHLPQELENRQWSRDDALLALLRARLTVLGPVTQERLARQFGVREPEMHAALARLESEGLVLRGPYGSGNADGWCERRLAARIQRYSRDCRRHRAEPISAGHFVAFLFRWQHLHPETRMRGEQSLGVILPALEGFGLPAGAWEQAVLPARIENYDPADLDRVCQSGQFTWLRLGECSGLSATIGTLPIALVPRRSQHRWRPPDDVRPLEGLSAAASALLELLQANGAMFYDELIERSGRFRGDVERGLTELVARGAVTSDAFAGLRALLVPASRKQRYRGLNWGLEQAGRWAITGARNAVDPESAAEGREEYIARVLLRRYGIIFRALLARESQAPPWHVLVRAYRRLEARGEISGGRFVAGSFGEQYALPEATAMLQDGRIDQDATETWISAADPLNLCGIVLSGAKIPANSGRWILFRGGTPIAIDNGRGNVQAIPGNGVASGNARTTFPARNTPRPIRAYGPRDF